MSQRVLFGFIAALIFLLPIRLSSATGKDGSYFCASEVEGGLTYDSTLKRWRATSFNPKTKFVLKLEFVKALQDGSQTIESYRVTITRAGTKDARPCYAQTYSLQPSFPGEVTAYADYSEFSCSTIYRSYKINMKQNRFLEIYEQGYVGGDNNDDTPIIAAGTCTRTD
jgi:hypothetical protein